MESDVATSGKSRSKVLSLNQVFFANLLLLGFDVNAEQRKHGVSFHADMFRKPNEKGLFVVLYFLIVRLYPKSSKEVKVVRVSLLQ
jgi:hypothetical protein